MGEKDELRRDLLARIEARRTAVQYFLRENRPGVRRRANTTIVLSSLAAVFTAGPALGGKTFAEGVQNLLRLSDDTYVWRVLCLAAVVVSVGAAVMTNLAKSHEAAANRLTTAEAAKAELEGLAGLVEYGQLPLEDAVKLFHQYSVKIPFIDDVPVVVSGSTRAACPA
jgi:cytochrome bd-type quinol oxidase subunit 2